jgi:hypothetical protein
MCNSQMWVYMGGVYECSVPGKRKDCLSDSSCFFMLFCEIAHGCKGREWEEKERA